MDMSHEFYRLGIYDKFKPVPYPQTCKACLKRSAVLGEDYCERCDNYTHVRSGLEVVASYDDRGNRVNLRD